MVDSMSPGPRPTRPAVDESSNQKLWLPRCQKRSAAPRAVRNASAASSLRAAGSPGLSRTPGGDVQPHVVEQEVPVAQGLGDVVDVPPPDLLRGLLGHRR